MSISPTNIKTRIELETRVLAAALKQSFERGDSDGVGLAHRQLFLLLKDQKPGNGSSSATAETTPAGSNGDTSGYEEGSEEAIAYTEEQPAYVPEVFAESENTEYAQPVQALAEMTNYQQDADQQQEGQPSYEAVEEEQSEDAEESEDSKDSEESEDSEDSEDAEELEQEQYVEDEEIPQVQQELEVQYVDPQPTYQIEEPQDLSDPEQAQAIAQYLKYKKTREQLSAEETEQSDNVSAQGWHEIEAQTTAPLPAEEVAATEPQQPLSEEEEYIRMRKAPPAAKEILPFDQPSAEYAEIFGSSIVESVPGPAQSPDTQPGPFDALVEPPSYGQFISSTPPSSHTPLPIELPTAEEQQGPASYSEEVEQPVEVRQSEMDFDVQPNLPIEVEHAEQNYVAETQPTATATETETATKTETEIETEYVAALASEHVVEPEFEQVSATIESETAAETAQPPAADSTADEIAPPPSFEGQFYSPQNLGIRNMASGFAPPPEASDLPPELRQAPTTEFPKIPRPTTQDLPLIAHSATEDLAIVEQSPAQDSPTAGQYATQDMPQIVNDIRSQQAADYAARKASQSAPRTMPAIDFSLQSESNKPDIDFSLQSESNAPNIDFTTQPKSNKPDIDFSLQSESSKPDIDFSLQSESQIQSQDGSLNAPTGGGFIEAEFVSSDSDSAAEDRLRQDVTSELPILNPTASLYLEPDETDESQTQKLAAQQLAAAQSEAQTPVPAVPVPPKSTVPFTGIPMMVIPNHAAPPAPSAPPVVQSNLAKSAASETTGQEEPLPVVPKPPDLYAMLGVSQMSPFEEIHKNFLRKIRKILLKLRGAVRPERDELLKELRRNWVARDILCDPVTRTDYDFRDMGLRGSADGSVPHVEDGPQRIGQRTPLRIGELLQCAGLLEQAELEIACDMHKAMPEVQFGTFLVRQGFIQERDLDSVLLGQTLLRDGKITVAQFQVAMELSQSRGANISDTLIEHGYITAAELAQLTEKAAEASGQQGTDTPTIKEVAVKPRQIESTPTNLTASSAVPTWKDQLDWSKPLPVDDDASLIDRNPEKQSLAELLGNVNTEVSGEPDKVKISNNAAPSWKDQLDWEQPSDTATTTATTGSADAPPEAAEQTGEPTPISSANAVPSWRDQLDWEQPKEESHSQPQDSGTASIEEIQVDESESYDDEPTRHPSKETQPISIHPPTSVAPNVTLDKGNPGTESDTELEATAEDKYLQEVLQTTDIFEQSIETGAVETAHSANPAEEHDVHDEHDSEDDEHPSEAAGEGFFKRSLGKLKKSDPKDKDKKKKRK